MARETRPAWVVELKRTLARPYTPEELARLREWDARIERLNAGRSWPPGTFQRLLDLVRAEDAQPGN